MADLLDIAPSTAVDLVKINGQRITVRGISVDAIAGIVSRFPELRDIASSTSDDIVPRLVVGCARAIGPIIAAGCGHPGEEAYEQHAAKNLLPEDQLRLVAAIFGLTFPNGLGAFLSSLTGVMGGAGEGAKVYTVRLRKSPLPSQSSSDADSHPTMQ